MLPKDRYRVINYELAEELGLSDEQQQAVEVRDFLLARKLGVSVDDYLLLIHR